MILLTTIILWNTSIPAHFLLCIYRSHVIKSLDIIQDVEVYLGLCEYLIGEFTVVQRVLSTKEYITRRIFVYA